MISPRLLGNVAEIGEVLWKIPAVKEAIMGLASTAVETAAAIISEIVSVIAPYIGVVLVGLAIAIAVGSIIYMVAEWLYENKYCEI